MERKKRNSSLELLRIICIILIIAHHYTVHGGYDVFTVDNFSINTAILQILSLWGKMACNIFILITGYFMIKSKFNFKKFILLILEMIFYSLGIVIVLAIFKLHTFSLKEIIKATIPMFYGNWFLVNYLILYCLIPFLNKIINGLEKKTFRNFLIVTLVICCVIPTVAFNSKFEFNDFDIMLVMYFIGAYIGIYFNDEKRNIYTKMMIILNIILVLSVIFFDYIGIKINKDNLIKNATYFSRINSILTIFGAISTFLYFAKHHNYLSKTINFLSSSVLGIYLIHDNEYIREIIWKKVYPNVLFINTNFFILHIIIKIFCVFIICLLIDKLRIYFLESKIIKIIDKNQNKVKEKLNNIFIGIITYFREKIYG